jgi:hypothetical protein
MCTMCATFPFGLLGGSIVLEGFVGNMLRSEPGSTQEEESPANKWFCCRLELHRIEWTRSVEETHEEQKYIRECSGHGIQ